MEDVEEESDELWLGSTLQKRAPNVEGEILLGGRKCDCRRELAKCVLAYLENLTHLVLFAFGGYSSAGFRNIRYGDLILPHCIIPEVLDYINRCFRTIFRWLTFSKLKKFSILIVDEDDVIQANYVICLYTKAVSKYDNAEKFEQQILELKQLFETSLLEVQCQASQFHTTQKRRRLELQVSLVDGAEHLKHRPLEYSWIENSKTASEYNIEPCCSPVSSPLIKVVVACIIAGA